MPLHSDRARFCDLVAAACRWRLPGSGSGSAFRSHPQWVVRRGMILVEHHTVSNTCHASVLTEPNASVRAGCNDSCAHGDPYPKVSAGEMVEVFRNGTFHRPGPWIDLMAEILSELQAEVAAAAEKDALHRAELREKASRHHDIQFDRAAAALARAGRGQ